MQIIIGMGQTGISCLNFLSAEGFSCTVFDSRESPPNLEGIKARFPDTPIVCGESGWQLLTQAERIIISPGVDPRHPAIVNAQRVGIPIVGDVELFAQVCQKPVIAITGSNAKGTVTTLVGDMANAAGLNTIVAGNIGLSVLDTLSSQASADLYVLELSSFQLETVTSLKPLAACVLNISPDHLDRYDSFEAYQSAKQRIYAHADYHVINADDPLTLATHKPKHRTLSFSLKQPLETDSFGIREHENTIWLARDSELLLPVTELRIQGKHNWSNALAALALSSTIPIPLNNALKALQQFKGLPHRCRWIREKNQVRYYNDSKATNIGAAIAALEGLGTDKPNIIWIAGGDSKQQDLNLLRPYISRYVKHAILLGKDAGLIEHALTDLALSIHRCHTLQDCVEKAHALAKAHDIVLLSPACSSLDMFRHFEDRGEQFEQLVQEL